MATKKFIGDIAVLLFQLSTKSPTNKDIEEIGSIYYKAFEHYSNKQIKEAVEKYLAEGQYFPPRPYQITDLITTAKIEKHNKELRIRYTCPSCHQKVSAISDGICLDCGGFMPSEDKEPLYSPREEDDFKMEGRIQCQG